MKTAVLFFLIPIVGIAQMNFEKKLPSNAPYQTEIISGDGVSAYGDLDNDGDLDLITTVSAYTVNYTRVYLNENGNFIRQSSFNPVNFNGYSGLVIFDRNQDGNLDFISSGYDSNSSFNTNFYYGDGTGNFTEDPSFNIVGLNAPSILVDDLTGDLKEDILISGTQTGNVSTTFLYVNDGSGNYTLNTTSGIAQNQIGSVASIDADNNGTRDVIFAGYDNNIVEVVRLYLNNGTGQFTDAGNPFSTVYSSAEISVGDLNGDNLEDVLFSGMANGTNNSWSQVYMSDGAANFTPNASYGTVNLRGAHELTDIDNDSDQDIIIAGYNNLTFERDTRVYLNDGSGGFTEDPMIHLMNWEASDLSAFDSNGDGLSELFMFGPQCDQSYYINNGGEYFPASECPILGTHWGATGFADVDNDNDIDLYSSGDYNNGFPRGGLYLNDGTGDYVRDPNSMLDSLRYGDVDFFDADGDGDQDLLMVGDNNSVPIAQLLLNDGSGSFSPSASQPFSPSQFAAIAHGDLDGDNDPDVIVAAYSGSSNFYTNIYLNNGSGIFTPTANPLISIQQGSISLGDIDNDTDLDLFLSGIIPGSNTFYSRIFLNNGAAVFTGINTGISNIRFSDSEFADLDNDGDLDLVIAGEKSNYNRIAEVYLNNGSGTFTLMANPNLTGTHQSGLAVADFNMDGSLDLVITGRNSSDVPICNLFFNNGSAFFTPYSVMQFPGLREGQTDSFDANGDGKPDFTYSGRHYLARTARFLYLNDYCPSPSSSTIAAAVCESYLAPNGQVFSNTGTYTVIIPNAAGCDSVITLELEVRQASSSQLNVLSCGSYTWDQTGVTYFATGTYSDTVPNAAGCDSIITLHLTLGSNSGTDFQQACNSYTWIDGVTYTSSTTSPSWTLTNTSGCDSLVTLHLTLYPTPEASVTQNGASLTANASGYAYQWVNCDTGLTSVTGETSQQFTATENGSYAVIVSSPYCSDTSTCFTVSGLSVDELSGDRIMIYPNPTTGTFTVLASFHGTFPVHDLRGRYIMEGSLNSEHTLSGLTEGMYLLTIGDRIYRLLYIP